ncbi:hypothetical protein GCM10007301_01790 [Azorhizobium oxalatiphilum]|uniref:Glycosyltransferase n=1 Tax=Azorhizobium oxalatiphilum TaxID=980631 RepID=A0A917F4K7_9HYPH|nr:hypothetical protein [Azorhizobium oxalatiphilum]GGF45936.1 hypothetical protein GCM10007301_01790 [Azorhizobium oxalatiphilum]
MRALKDYSPAEWLAAEPLAHRLRRARNLVVDQIYRRRRAPGQAELVARLKAERAPALAFTIAFNLPEAIALLADGMARFAPGLPLVVCDNSSRPEARAAIAALCAERGLAYCPLPPSPFKGGANGSRSHGVALNWVLHALIRPVAPKVFALLDHDLVPLAPVDLPALVAAQPAYGMVRHGTKFGGWFLWPGYSVFDFGAVAELPLDFGTDTPLTLDTGGQNWRVLYRRLDAAGMAQAYTRTAWIADPDTGSPEPYLLADGWLHVGGAGHRGGGAAALASVRAAYEADPDGLLDRLLETATA